MKIKRVSQDGVTVLKLSNNVMGGSDYDLFMSEIQELVDQGHGDIVLDLGKVKWINSTGLGILVSGFHRVRKCGGEMKICNINRRIDVILNVTQLQLVFETYDTLDEAIGSYLVTC